MNRTNLSQMTMVQQGEVPSGLNVHSTNSTKHRQNQDHLTGVVLMST